MLLCSDPRAQNLTYRDEIRAAFDVVVDGGSYILGENVTAFESEFAGFCGVAHAVGVANGSDAIHLALRALGIGAGDEVVTVSHTAVATVAAVEMAGATPVAVDIEPAFYTMDPNRIEAAVTPRTRAILPVHLYGQPADMNAIMEIARAHDLHVIEDCAQAHGATWQGQRVGGIGDVGCFSFYPTKNLGAIGDGGALVTGDPDLADRARRLRQYGWNDARDSCVAGWNSRLDELQAAFLRVKLAHLDEDTARRRAIAVHYGELLDGLPLRLPGVRAGAAHVWHLYVAACDRRDELVRHLRECDIAAGVHYPVPVHRQTAYAGRITAPGPLPLTECAAAEVISLPMYPELTPADAGLVVDAVTAFFEA